MDSRTIILLLGLVAAASATTCYVCATGTSCGDEYGMPNGHATDCTQFGYTEDGGCSKLKTKGKVGGFDVTTVTRTCGKTYTDGCDYDKFSLLGVTSETWKCSCTGDKCNDAGKATLSTVTIAAVIMKALLL